MLGYCLSECAKTKLWYFKRGLSRVFTNLIVFSTIVLAYFTLALIVQGISVAIFGTIILIHHSLLFATIQVAGLTILGAITFVVFPIIFEIIKGFYKVTKKVVNVALNHDEFECKWIVKCEKG